MNIFTKKRNPAFIKILYCGLWPVLKCVFRIQIEGTENIPSKGPLLFVSNHNAGALIESHSSLFVLQKKIPDSIIYGFTHPSIFKVPGFKQYFEWIGAVPATYDVAANVFKKGDSLLIFPGGNRQALRSIWDYKKMTFKDSHGWAKIACTHHVPVVPITFKGSHFVNPIFLSGEWVSKILILPWLLGQKWATISLGQILISTLFFYLLKNHSPLMLTIAFTYLVFILTPLALIIPFPVQMRIHLPLDPAKLSSQEELENKMAEIMRQIYP